MTGTGRPGPDGPDEPDAEREEHQAPGATGQTGRTRAGAAPEGERPEVGKAVRDTRLGRIGVVMGGVGPYVQLRPLQGGREWDADPEHIEPVTVLEVLSVRVAEANANSRTRRGLNQG
ncbi:hypothetical protein ACIBCM_22465 [Streptomyces sp. NPDC051018]|uniref:hypothetical protein n=1 Tax=Streptomyces sp. NPDC051018 TaxID=3365639 RepID=UPI0037ACB57B